MAAIAFGRCEYISRSRGQNPVAIAAYCKREAMWSERAGKTFRPFEPHQVADNLHHQIRVLEEARHKAANAEALWNLADWKETRKNSQTAKHIVLALPNDTSLTLADWVRMVQEFVDHHFVRHGIPVQIDIHRGHPGGDPETLNPHAHLIVGTRRLSADGFFKRKARDLEAAVRSIIGRPKVVEATAWGAAWGEFQDQWFKANNHNVKVDPVAPFPAPHLGSKRRQSPHDPRQSEARSRADLNAKRGHFARGDRRRIAKAASERAPTLQSIAEELSAEYRQLRERGRWLNGMILRHTAFRDDNLTHRDNAKAKYDARWEQLGAVRKGLDLLGRWRGVEPLRDVDLDEARRRIRRHDRAATRHSIRIKEYRDKLKGLIQPGREALNAVRSEAEAELARREEVKLRAQQQTIDSGPPANTPRRRPRYRRS